MVYPTFRYYYAGGDRVPNVTDGQLLIGNSNGVPILNNVTAGNGIIIDNGPGTITVSAVSAEHSHFELYDVNDTLPVYNVMLLGAPQKVGYKNVQSPFKEGFDVSIDGTVSYLGDSIKRIHCGASFTVECDTNNTVITLFFRKSIDGGVTYSDLQSSFVSVYYVNNAFGEPVSTAIHTFIQSLPGDKYQLWAVTSKACSLKFKYINMFGMAMPYMP